MGSMMNRKASGRKETKVSNAKSSMPMVGKMNKKAMGKHDKRVTS